MELLRIFNRADAGACLRSKAGHESLVQAHALHDGMVVVGDRLRWLASMTYD